MQSNWTTLFWSVTWILYIELGKKNSPGKRLCTFVIPELKELVDIHRQFEEDNEEPLSVDEVLIIKVQYDKDTF